MKIYALLVQEHNRSRIICISNDANKIRLSICTDLDPMEDYPELQIWENEKIVYKVEGNEVLRKIADEIAQ